MTAIKHSSFSSDVWLHKEKDLLYLTKLSLVLCNFHFSHSRMNIKILIMHRRRFFNKNSLRKTIFVKFWNSLGVLPPVIKKQKCMIFKDSKDFFFPMKEFSLRCKLSFNKLKKRFFLIVSHLFPLQVYKKKTEAAKKDYLKALAAYRASLVSQVSWHWLWVA